MSKQTNYIDYIQPMIDDLKDGVDEPLTERDVDGLMNVIRAKVELKEGLITEEEYTTLLHSAYDI
jgi:hypothetical protein